VIIHHSFFALIDKLATQDEEEEVLLFPQSNLSFHQLICNSQEFGFLKNNPKFP